MVLMEMFGDSQSPTNILKTQATALVKSIAPQAEVDIFTKALEGQTYLTISRIVLPKDQRRQGLGSKVMRALTQYADKHNIIIALSPSSDFGTGKSTLIKFYKQFGFVANSGRNKDWQVNESMIRYPSIKESIFSHLTH